MKNRRLTLSECEVQHLYESVLAMNQATKDDPSSCQYSCLEGKHVQAHIEKFLGKQQVRWYKTQVTKHPYFINGKYTQTKCGYSAIVEGDQTISLKSKTKRAAVIEALDMIVHQYGVKHPRFIIVRR
jgi:hypothetical protein